MKTFFFCDKHTREILTEAYELEQTNDLKSSDLVVLSCSGFLSSKITGVNPTVTGAVPFGSEEQEKIKSIFYLAKILGKPVISFGTSSPIIHILNGGRIFNYCDGHFGKEHKVWAYDREKKCYNEDDPVTILSHHLYCVRFTSENWKTFKIHASAFCSKEKRFTNEKPFLLKAPLDRLKEKSYYTSDPEVYSWKLGENVYALCFEFFPSKRNFEFVSKMIMEHSGVTSWPG